ncbi:helicase [Alkalicoccobacillus porphyridii]|uniref:Helicase n=1 Tax=Alkalicoccobacillus porphyridii TaxID=2597270 RepID=A0A554A1L1_9BACI|nr:helicase [Alkalicoccobacillus porphyridii]
MYPNCPITIRTIQLGVLTKLKLIEKFRQHSILLNEAGEKLFASDLFTTSETNYLLTTVELSVGDLGLYEGATTDQLFKRAKDLNLSLGPLELGPLLRLQYLDQPEGFLGKPIRQNQAPFGSITISSEILSENDDFPKGFYIRKIDGALWLRGYRADQLHVWQADDQFVFCRS